MATAEKVVVEREPASPQQRLVMSSLLGTVFVLASLYFVLAGLPLLWGQLGLSEVNAFLSTALLIVVEIGAIVGVLLLGRRLEGSSPPHGLRAGIFMLCVFFLIDL